VRIDGSMHHGDCNRAWYARDARERSGRFRDSDWSGDDGGEVFGNRVITTMPM
jgi:hypothetical protein